MQANEVWCALRGITQHPPEHPGVHDVARHSDGCKYYEEQRVEQEECACYVLHTLELHPGPTAGTIFIERPQQCREEQRRLDAQCWPGDYSRGRTVRS